MADSSLPVGDAVEPIAHGGVPRRMDYIGEFVTLSPVNPQADVEQLFAGTQGSAAKEQVWTYLPYGPFDSVKSMQEWLAQRSASNDELFLTVRHNETQRRIGIVSFINMDEEMRRLEIGNIWYTPAAQRTQANTEAVYLMLCEAFDRLHYRRVEWKCDSLNARSRAAALRLGFSFEGIFRQHMIRKGRNRDTAWFAMLDSEWSLIKRNFETWLYRNPDWKLSLAGLNSGRI